MLIKYRLQNTSIVKLRHQKFCWEKISHFMCLTSPKASYSPLDRTTSKQEYHLGFIMQLGY